MDKDEYFKLLEEVCAYNLIDPFKDKNWYSQTLLSNVQKSGEIFSENSSEQDKSKESKVERNLIKYFE
jgi:hypothetical protein